MPGLADFQLPKVSYSLFILMFSSNCSGKRQESVSFEIILDLENQKSVIGFILQYMDLD